MPDAFPAWVIPVVFGLMGACIGSFLNVVIYRMPRGVSVNDPGAFLLPGMRKTHSLVPEYSGSELAGSPG